MNLPFGNYVVLRLPMSFQGANWSFWDWWFYRPNGHDCELDIGGEFQGVLSQKIWS